jgi:hypothetical protein
MIRRLETSLYILSRIRRHLKMSFHPRRRQYRHKVFLHSQIRPPHPGCLSLQMSQFRQTRPKPKYQMNLTQNRQTPQSRSNTHQKMMCRLCRRYSR